MSLLKATHLTKSFRRGGQSFEAVSNASFELVQGEFAAIVGRSGSGKTTLLNLLAGLLSPDRGAVEIDSVQIHSLSDDALTDLRNKKIGIVPQGRSLLGALTVLDNVRLPIHLSKNRNISRPKAMELLEQLEVGFLAGSFPAALSGGELRRVSLARALIGAPLLVIADEPTSDLDSESAENLLALLRRLNEGGMTFLIATHDEQAVKSSGRVLQMASGVLEAVLQAD
ncbi:MAG: ATP-binding cassette domain-containing protein [Deltaproteobacteria bacterium]|nr:ATP-binding cassette domain-containing protein [Deltaproteobacteria bacterium]